jgi:diacylglycerol kinase (ATP)
MLSKINQMNGNAGLKLLFVINPGAGASNNSWQNIISNYFTGKPFRTDFYQLEKKPDINKLKRYITASNADRVIAVGGDGTVGLVAKSIAGSKMALGILPAGSANGMAKELNILEDPEEALAVIERGTIKRCDAISINSNTCLHLSDIGLNAQLIKYFDEGKLRGKLGYARVIIKTLLNKKKLKVVIKRQNEVISRDAFMVVLANASKYGTGAVINPTGLIDDGMFEVVIVMKLSLIELLKMLFRPRPFNPQNIEILHAETVSIKTSRKVHFQVDGEYLGRINRIEARILPNFINILLPPVTSDRSV